MSLAYQPTYAGQRRYSHSFPRMDVLHKRRPRNQTVNYKKTRRIGVLRGGIPVLVLNEIISTVKPRMNVSGHSRDI